MGKAWLGYLGSVLIFIAGILMLSVKQYVAGILMMAAAIAGVILKYRLSKKE
jgi:hypothetical protein